MEFKMASRIESPELSLLQGRQTLNGIFLHSQIKKQNIYLEVLATTPLK